MSEKKDIRWEQRFSNYVRAFHKLNEAVVKINKDYGIDEHGNLDDDEFIDDILKEGVIKRFEYTYELAWNVMKDYAEFQGNPNIPGSRSAIREALQMGLITNGKTWMDMVESRIRTSHTYNEETADGIFKKIMEEYHPAFNELLNKMEALRSGEQGDIF